jgi:peptidoglycan/LPS O-acetylase OafA/YrhL
MIYRREIDGLRALAIVPVILFHAGLQSFSGGYVGVDIFFVISGYLITGILIDELEQDKFSIARFYERRARRILPALFFVMLCCIPFAWMWMMPSELRDFSQSLIAVTLFISNILFWREEGYFAPAAELKPMLHTWSLAVEEQYYLLFPIFLMLTWRFGRNRVVWAILCMATVSFLLSEWGWRNKPSANFYLAPTRAWELLAGSLCAFWLNGREQRPNSWLSSLGLVLIFFSIFYYDEETPFPSLYTTIPIFGTTLIIIFGNSGTYAAKLLEMRALVSIGLISYSAYLWHQPLFAFARITSIDEPNKFLMLGLSGLSLALGYLSWLFVEKRFRNGQGSLLSTRRQVFAVSVVMGSAMLAIGFVGHFGKGFEQRFDSRLLAFDRAKNDRADTTCFFDERRKLPTHPHPGCFNARLNSDTVFLLGDSHANAISNELKNFMDEKRINYYDMSYSEVVPVFWTGC